MIYRDKLQLYSTKQRKFASLNQLLSEIGAA